MSRGRVVVPVMAGIGNAVMTVPMVRRLGETFDVTIEAGSAAIGDVFGRLPEVDRVVVLNGGLTSSLRRHRTLGGDLYVVPFPSNRWQYMLLAATTPCRRVVMHDYPVGTWRTGRRFVRGLHCLPAREGLHDVDQNLHLATHVLDVSGSRGLTARRSPPTNTTLFPLNIEERDDARSLPLKAILLQPGCGNTVIGRSKRLPDATWVDVIHRVTDLGMTPVIVEGPDERGVGERIATQCNPRPEVIVFAGKLGESAATIEQAAAFVAVDSGLAHVAAAVGVPTVSVFTAADPDRVAPVGNRHLVVTPRDVGGTPWSPRTLYPMHATRPTVRDDGIDWPRHVSADDILARLQEALSPDPAPAG